MQRSVWLPLPLLLSLGACGEIQKITAPAEPPLKVAPVARLTLRPGEKKQLGLNITLKSGVTLGSLKLSNPAPEIITASLRGSTLTVQAQASAVEQGLIPLSVDVQAAATTVHLKIPVEIGDLIKREFARYTALRAQANLAAVSFDETASMNCWLHGRYSVLNHKLEHNQNPALPGASPEGQACATRSNIAMDFLPEKDVLNATPSTTILFTAPFHALGMLQPDQARVGIGTYSVPASGEAGFVQMGSGITSLFEERSSARAPMTFPGQGRATDLGRYNGGEWPNPLTPCPTSDPQQTGLPLIAATFERGDTVATEASLLTNGHAVPVCAYGSSQYVNAKDAVGNYEGGLISAQDIGRSILKGSGAVFIIPLQPLQAAQTYQVSVKINGQPLSWTFSTASTLKAQSLASPGRQVIR